MRFRPQQGLTIMNKVKKFVIGMINTLGFRPQQGLTIMNVIKSHYKVKKSCWFPSPTGVNHYELIPKQGCQHDTI